MGFSYVEICGGSSTSASSSDEEQDSLGAPAGGQVSDRLISESLDTAPPQDGRRLCRVVVGVAALVLLSALGLVFHDWISQAATELLVVVGQLGWISVVIVALVIALMCVLMLPTFPLLIATTVEFTKVFGVHGGMVASLCSSFGGLWLGSVAAFQLGRTLWKGQAKEHAGDEAHGEFFRVITRMIDQEGVKIVFLARMSPLLPAEVFNYACSMTSLSLAEWGVGCIGSIVPIGFWVVTTVQATNAADGGGRHDQMANLAFLAFNVTLLVSLTAMMYLSYSKYRDAERAKEPREAHLASGVQLLKLPVDP